MSNKEIAIIGGGIAGLTLAICLKNSGYNCHVFEKNSEFKEVGAAISIFPNALRVFREKEVIEDILAESGEVTKVFLKTCTGEILAKSEPVYDLPAICLHRADLHRVLLKNAGAQLYAAHELKDLRNLPGGNVEVVFGNGAAKVFDSVVGADGIHSAVREFVVGDGEPVFRGYNVWRGVVETDFGAGYASETYGAGKRVGIVPIKNGRYGWWATCNESFLQPDEPEGTRRKLEKLFGDWHAPIPELLSKTEDILKNSIADRKPSRGWTKGNITLLGDAAHPTTPNLGQGGCLAVEGAYILAKAIRKYGISDEAFRRYERLQFPRAKSIVEASLRMGQMGQIENSAAIYFRNLAFKLTLSRIALKMMDRFFSYDVAALKI